MPADPYADADGPGSEAVSTFASARPSVEIARMRLWLYASQRAEEAAASALPQISGKRSHRRLAFTAWYSLIQGYSERDLTNVADTLPAVGGMAAVLELPLGKSASYFRGLWAEDFHRGLLWYVAMNDNWQVRGLKATRGEETTAEIGAPSWSLAAVGKVRVRFFSLRFVKRWTAQDLGTASNDNIEAAGLVKVKGDVLSAWPLRLNAPMRRLRLKKDTEYASWRTDRSYRRPGASNSRFEDLGIATDGVHPRFPALLCDTESQVQVVGEAALDGPSEFTEESDTEARDMEGLVSCVALQKWETDSKAQWACLILAPIGPNATEYKRIGVGFIFEGACFGKDHDQGWAGYGQSRVLWRDMMRSAT